MKSQGKPALEKAPTGIQGLDGITGGGLPRGRTTLVLGGPGYGKTILALQTLVNGARAHGEPGIFVAFEESPRRIIANAASFGWDLPDLQRRKLFFLDAQVGPELVQAGGFDLQGLLAALDAKVRTMRAKRIVFDAIDVLLALLDDPAAQRREIHRLLAWLLDRGLTAIITSKTQDGRRAGDGPARQLQFMVDCAVALGHQIVTGVSQRCLRVMKFRGSSFAENEMPLVIGGHGMEVAWSGLPSLGRASTERVTTGVARLDTMLGGGYYRGASILITGSPGTAKSTLSGAFAEGACARGERTLFVSFDTAPAETIRNFDSVHVRLGRFVRSGLLRMELGRKTEGNAETHLVRIRELVREHRARCLIIDPMSALGNLGNEDVGAGAVERMLGWAKGQGLTTLFTSLLLQGNAQAEGTPMQISTIADTWLHLSYTVQAGERNRALTIVKSRGMGHSNQVRELILSDRGISLADVYTTDGQVLMGTMRWEKERAVRAAQLAQEAELERKRVEIEVAQGDLNDRVKQLRRELRLKQVELDLLTRATRQRQRTRVAGVTDLKRLRGADGKADRRGHPRPPGSATRG